MGWPCLRCHSGPAAGGDDPNGAASDEQACRGGKPVVWKTEGVGSTKQTLPSALFWRTIHPLWRIFGRNVWLRSKVDDDAEADWTLKSISSTENG